MTRIEVIDFHSGDYPPDRYSTCFGHAFVQHTQRIVLRTRGYTAAQT